MTQTLVFVVVVIGISAFLHGYIPTGALAKIAGKNNPFTVVFVTLLGILLYSLKRSMTTKKSIFLNSKALMS